MESVVEGLAAGLAAANLMLVGATRSDTIIANIEVSRAILIDAAELLREAARDTEKFAGYAFDLVPAGTAPPFPDETLDAATKLLTASLFNGPLPGSLVTVWDLIGRVFSCLLPSEYEQILESRRNLVLLGALYLDASRFFDICAQFLSLPRDDGTVWQRWRDHHVYGIARTGEAGVRLATTNHYAMDTRHDLRPKVGDILRKDEVYTRADHLSLIEENLHDAMNEINEALLLLRQMRFAVVQQFFLMVSFTQHLQHQA